MVSPRVVGLKLVVEDDPSERLCDTLGTAKVSRIIKGGLLISGGNVLTCIEGFYGISDTTKNRQIQ